MLTAMHCHAKPACAKMLCDTLQYNLHLSVSLSFRFFSTWLSFTNGSSKLGRLQRR